MIIVAPRIGPVIAGSSDLRVNTQAGGSRYVATGFASESRRAGIENLFDTGRIKRRAAQGAGNTPNRANPTVPLGRQKPQEKGGQAVSKPMAPSYCPHGRPAATSARQPVTILTVSVVD